jgi:antitoxin component YwqK of YwqJK toxin-antitoxin module
MLRVEYNDPNMTLRNRPTNWGSGVYLYNGAPFTGVMVYRENNGQITAEYEYKDGIFDGRQATYWPNGNLEEEYFQKYDYHIGAFKRWNEQGVLISHQEFDELGNWIKTIL